MLKINKLVKTSTSKPSKWVGETGGKYATIIYQFGVLRILIDTQQVFNQVIDSERLSSRMNFEELKKIVENNFELYEQETK